ncbi:phosphatidate cytidylyltransferase [Bacteroidales bacterium OttesenSCG-928-I14]|nr:phosphatidate cytidylyltransferase [Bacteroidales bacterium OttesenSCG-928-I14]
MKNLLQRSLTGLVYITLILVGVLWNQYSFLALFVLITILCLSEFYGLINKQKQTHINRTYDVFGGLVLFVCTYIYASGLHPSLEVYLFYVFYLVTVFVSNLYSKSKDPLKELAYTVLGQIYIALPLSLLNFVVFSNNLYSGMSEYKSLFLLALFVFIWVNDTGAYLTGITIGKHKLFKRISPKKSWEGFFGGLVFSVVASLVFYHFNQDIPYYHWMIMAALVTVFGTWGDLVESLMKRTLKVKDSGASLPGHGGFLDRFDSLLLAAYVMVIYTHFI